MYAIILAGGFGTRLRSALAHVPKPMAPIQDKPFLAYLLEYLKTQGIREVILSVHYLREQIQNYFKTSYQGLAIRYAVEETPLGTGGAMAHALKLLDTTEPIFIVNGDTFLKLNYRAMLAQHQKTSPLMTMALRHVDDCGRYGAVLLKDNHITSFVHQGEQGPGFINGGVYLIQPHLFHALPSLGKSFFNAEDQVQPFSFEQDFLFPYSNQLKPQAFVAEDYFIDIGIPEDYVRAQQEICFNS